MSKGVVFSGMRPTGKLHIGHLSVLDNWIDLQKEYRCYFSIVDWHALTTAFENTSNMQENIRMMLLDWLGAGLDFEKSPLFIQSQVKEHAELHLLFSMTIPVSWLERVPTYKDQIQQFKLQSKDVATYGFLGYPVLMAADILVYRADTVPVGEDQLAHLELCRELARRFNYLYKSDIFPEPKAKLAQIPLLPGVDGRKMSKSYNNDIPIGATKKEIQEKVQMMITDPARIKKNDPGNPDICVVNTYQSIYNKKEIDEIRYNCRAGNIGCVMCKKRLAEVLDEILDPLRERREYYEKRPDLLCEILETGAKNAREEAIKTLSLVRDVMNIAVKW